jgi:hypothetical protein
MEQPQESVGNLNGEKKKREEQQATSVGALTLQFFKSLAPHP